MILLGENGNSRIHYWAGRHPGRVGLLLTPDRFRRDRVRPWLPYALDNGAWQAFLDEIPLDVETWIRTAREAASTCPRPLWIAVPDVVGDHLATLALWDALLPETRRLEVPLAYVAQDGSTPDDVPPGADLVFLGGSTDWKWRNLPSFATLDRPLHVGRVNTPRRLRACHAYGVASVDGTGWFRGGWNSRQARQLGDFLAEGSLFS